jgi:hypothetical protein
MCAFFLAACLIIPVIIINILFITDCSLSELLDSGCIVMSGGIIIGNGEKAWNRDREYLGIGNGILYCHQLRDRKL